MRACPHDWHTCSMEAIDALPHDDPVNAYSTRQNGYCLACGVVRVRLLSLDGRWTGWREVPAGPRGPKARKVSLLRYAQAR